MQFFQISVDMVSLICYCHAMFCNKKLIVAPLAVIVFATLLMINPTGGSDVPILSALTTETADAHPATKQVTKSRQVCSWQYKRVKVVVGYERAVNPRVPRCPVYAWKTELVRVCEKEQYTVTQNKRHLHVSDEVCKNVKVFVTGAASGAGGAAGGLIGAKVGGPAGAVIGGAAGAGAGNLAGRWVNKRVCSIIPKIIWLDWF